MPNLTAADLEVEVRVGIGGRNVSIFPQSRIFTMLNWAQRHIGHPGIYEHEELRSSENITLTSATLYTLVNSVLTVRHVRNSTKGYGLEVKPQSFLDDMSILTGGGRPSFYHSSGTSGGRTIEVYPAPNTNHQGDVLLVREYVETTDITLAGDTTSLAAIWDEAVVYGAIYRSWVILGQPIQRDLALEAYTGAINEIRNTLDVESREERSRSPQISVVRYQR